MTREELLQDVAYARALAEEGRTAPLLGGSHLVFWGALNAIAFTTHWGVLTGLVPAADGWAFAWIWITYGVAAGVGMTVLRGRIRGKPGLTAIGARAERAVWIGAALAVVTVAIGSIARMMIEQDTSAPNAIFGAAFALYGAALYATARLSQQMWLSRFAVLSVSVAGTLSMFANQPWAYLVAAAGSLLVLVWPGVILLKHEPSTLV